MLSSLCGYESVPGRYFSCSLLGIQADTGSSWCRLRWKSSRFGGAALMLYVQHRLALQVLAFGLVDLSLAALFIVAFLVMQQRTSEAMIR